MPLERLRVACVIAILLMSSVVLLTGSIEGEVGSWQTKSPMPTPRATAGTAVLGGEMYAIGGLVGGPGNDTEVDANEAYDPITDTWSQKAPLPTPRRGLVAATYDGKIYVMGGLNATVNPSVIYDSNDIYNPVIDAWTSGAPMPVGRIGAGAAVVSGRIYVVGGIIDGSSLPTDEVLEYDPVADSWSYATRLMVARQSAGLTVLKDKIYLFGGWLGWNSVEEYDPISGTSRLMNALPFGVSSPSVVTIDERIYIVGGGDDSECDVISLSYEFDPPSDSYVPVAPIPIPRSQASAAEINRKMYVAGGLSNTNLWCGARVANEEFTPPPPDNTPPSITITSPTNGQVINEGTTQIQGTATDPDGDGQITSVLIDIDGQGWQKATGTISWSYVWDTSSLSPGIHSVHVQAFDGKNTSNVAWVTVIVEDTSQPENNAPSVTITNPTSAPSLFLSDGSVLVEGSASDPDGDGQIESVEIKIDGGGWQSATGTAAWNFTWNWDPDSWYFGHHTVQARAYDGTTYSEIDLVVVHIQEDDVAGTLDLLPWLLLMIIVILAVLLSVSLIKTRGKPAENEQLED
ncbi:MAG: hypothetical protein KAR39_05595 [Thermoplasmata archaeon]|nr:hypothetical protein [Thermoplasmata archaeon]